MDAFDVQDLEGSVTMESVGEAALEQVLARYASAGATAVAAAATGRRRRLPAEQVVALRDELECALCCDLLSAPSTLPCGHTLCRNCVWRNLDHAFDSPPLCPLCRADLSPYLIYLNQAARRLAASNADGFAMGSGQIAPTVVLKDLLTEHFSEEVAARQTQADEEEALPAGASGGKGVWLPIFVCNLAYPMQPCPLHIFEPRYRLMMRRTIESGQKRFGMVMPRVETDDDDGADPGAETLPCMPCGTVLLIEHFEQQPDGRAHIETRGERRFKILEAKRKDGYMIARVEWLEDHRQEYKAHLNAWGREDSDKQQRLCCRMEPLDYLEPAQAAQVQLWSAELYSLVAYAKAANQSREDDVAANESDEFQRWPTPEDPHHMLYWILQVMPIRNGEYEKYKLVYEVEMLYSQMREVHLLCTPFLEQLRGAGAAGQRVPLSGWVPAAGGIGEVAPSCSQCGMSEEISARLGEGGADPSK